MKLTWFLRAAAAPALVAGGYWLGVAHGPWPAVAAGALAVLAFLSMSASRDVAIVSFIGVGAVLLALGFGVVPGFSRLPLGGASLNTAKLLAGLGAAAMFPSPLRWNARCTAIAAVTLIGVPIVAWAISHVRWAPATPEKLLWFAVANLFTVIAEEWFFRRWIQQPLQPHVGGALALLASAALFGLAHFAGGTQFMLLAALAGLGYGAVFWASGSIWAAVLLHLMLNVLRATLFGLS